MQKRLLYLLLTFILLFTDIAPSFASSLPDNEHTVSAQSDLSNVSDNDLSDNNLSDDSSIISVSDDFSNKNDINEPIPDEIIEEFFDGNNGTYPEDIPYEPENINIVGDDMNNDFLDNIYARKYVPEKNSIPFLRNQGNYGTCWAHASTYMAESSLISRGLADASINLSELQLAYFTYKTVVDPLGGTSGDVNGYKDNVDNILQRGGNLHFSEFVYSSWIGAAEEKKVPYNSTWINKAIGTGLSEDLAFDDYAHLEYSYEVNIKENPNAVKQLILDYGGVGCAYCSSSGYYMSAYNSYFNPTSSSINHSVTIVGWDDDFPKENFYSKGETVPAGNGAWLIRNSWYAEKGTEAEGYTNRYNGYFWMSYYDTTLSSAGYCFVFNTADNFDNNYQYDGSFAYGSLTTSGSGYYANIFTAGASEEGETLEAISFATPTTNLDYTIKIYRNLSGTSSPVSGTLVSECTTTGRTVYGGIHTVKLNSPLYMSKGTTFSVVLILRKSGQQVAIYTENNANSWYINTASIKRGQSFKGSSETKWTDLYSTTTKYNLRIKAYTVNGDSRSSSVPTSIVLDDTTKKGVSIGITATYEPSYMVLPESAENKRVLWTSSNESVATVSSKGLVTGIKAGTATITATAQSGGVSASFLVTVTNTPGSIYFEDAEDFSKVLYNNLVNIRVKTNLGDDVTAGTSWSVSDAKILSVNADGSIKAIGCGSAVLRADYKGIKNEIVIYVYPRTVNPDISIDKAGKITFKWNSLEEASSYIIRNNTTGAELKTIVSSGASSYTYTDTSYENYPTKKQFVFSVVSVTGDLYWPYVIEKTVYVGPTYEISYFMNGGTNNSDNSSWYRSGNFISLKTPLTTPTGYNSFVGWFTDSGFTNQVSGITSDVTGNVSLYAKYSPNIYNVYFYKNDGDISSDSKKQTITYGNATRLTANTFTRDNFVFTGWNTKADGTGIAYADKETVTNLTSVNNGSVFLYAQWEPVKYIITFDVNGGNELADEIKTKNVVYNQPIGELPVPVKEGYTFVGWFTSALGTTKWTSDTVYLKSANTTLYAHWSENIVYEDVTFDVNGGNPLAADSIRKTVAYKKLYGDLPKASRTGYKFDGWFTDVENGELITSSSKVLINGDHTLYAHWSPASYTVNFNVNGGKTLSADKATKTVTYMTPYGSLPVPERDGYSFIGWFTSAEGTTQITETSLFTRYTNITLYAHWKSDPFSVVFDGNGVDINLLPITVYIDGYYSGLPVPTAVGMNFEGWYDKAVGGNRITEKTKFTLSSPQRLYAHWSFISYTVYFDVNGGEKLPDDKLTKLISINSLYGELPQATRKGFLFTGWTTNEGDPVTEESIFTEAADQTLYAGWKAKEFTISFAEKDEYGRIQILSTQSVSYGGKIGKLPDVKEITGHRSLGWIDDNGDYYKENDIYLNDGDLTLYASYEKKEMKIVLDADGGNIDGDEVIYITYGDVVSELPFAVKDHYDFSGWFTENNEPVIEGMILSYSDEIKLTAKYSLHNYKIVMKLQGGNFTTLDSVVFNATYPNTVASIFDDTLLENPIRAKYTFAGWYDAENDGSLFNFDTIVDRDIYIYAYWDEIVIVDVSKPVSSVSDTEPLKKGTSVILSTETAGAYIYFSYDGTNYSLYSDPIIIEDDVTIYAYATLSESSKSDVSIFNFNVIHDEWGDVLEEDRPLYKEGLWLAGFEKIVEYPGYPVVFDDLRVYDSKKLLVKGIDYSVTYENNSSPGKATLTITGKGNYSSTYVERFQIKATTKKRVKDVAVKVTNSYKYSGEEVIPELELTYMGEPVTEEEIDISFTDNINSGTAYIYLEAKENSEFIGKKSASFKIEGINISSCKVYAADAEYTGETVDTVVVKFNEKTLVKEIDYRIECANDVDAGAKSVKIIGIGEFFGTITKNYNIVPVDFSDLEDDRFSVSIDSQVTYSKGGAKPNVSIVFHSVAGEEKLIENKDYLITCSNNKTTGIGHAIISGKGNYKGSIESDFEVTKKSLSDVTVQIPDAIYVNKNNAFAVVPVLVDVNGSKLKAGTDYSKKYEYLYVEDTVLVDGSMRFAGETAKSSDIVPVGTIMKINVNSIGSLYEGSAVGLYRIIRGNISEATVTIPNQIYDGSAVEPKKSQMLVKLGTTVLNDNDYEIVSFSKNNKKGTGKVTLKGVGMYGGEKTASFKVVEKSLGNTVVFDGNGYTSGSMKNLNIPVGGKKALTVNSYKRKGFVFAGWNTNPSGTGISYSDKSDFYAENAAKVTVLYAQWNPIEYSVRYHLNGGSNSALNTKISYTAEDSFAIYAPVKEDWPVGYQFAGWYTDIKYKNKINEIKKGTSGNIDLYARWIAYSYTVVYDANDDSQMTISEGFSFGVPKKLKKNGFAASGKIFKGWSVNSESATAEFKDQEMVCNLVSPVNNSGERITLYAIWSDEYEVLLHYGYMIDDEEKTEVITYAPGTVASLVEPKREGYIFKGWYTSSSFKTKASFTVKTKGNKEIYARWEKEKATIKYDGNGCDGGTVKNSETHILEDITIKTNKFVKYNYMFAGWNTKQDGTGEKFTEGSVYYFAPSDDSYEMTLYAQWIPYSYGITFELSGGMFSSDTKNYIRSYLYNPGEEYELPIPRLDGFSFGGWYKERTYKNKVSVISGTMSEDIILYAKWVVNDINLTAGRKFEVRYHLNNGADDFVTKYEYGKANSLIKPEYAGYSFTGWYMDNQFKTSIASISSKTSGDLELYAKWTPLKYKIVFDKNAPANVKVSGSMKAVSDNKFGNKTKLKKNAFKIPGYTFLGWSENPDDIVPQYKNSTYYYGGEYASVKTLYAIWEKDIYTISYANVLMGEFDSLVDTEFDVDSAIELPEPSRVGDTFLGWYTDSKYKKKITNVKRGTTKNLVVYAKWANSPFSIGYVLNGGHFDSNSVGFADTYDLYYVNSYKLPIPEKEGYNFAGWYAESTFKNQVTKVSSTKGITLYAKWVEK